MICERLRTAVNRLLVYRIALAVFTAALAGPVVLESQTVTAVLRTGAGPGRAVINPVTNKIYVANRMAGSVTVIDGATNRTTTVTVGLGPDSLAVNPATNHIYVANHDSATLTVIDGAGGTTTSTLTVGLGPAAVAVNPVTNKIYVANNGSDNVTVVDGASNSTSIIAAGKGPSALAVNPVTNQIFVANQDSGTVTVIDGVSQATTTVAVGKRPEAVAVNPATNKVYVVDHDSDAVTVIDGLSRYTKNVPVGAGPAWVAVNAVTNKIYVADHDGATVTVINGGTNGTSSVATGTGTDWVEVNATTNQVYATNGDENTITVIDGGSNSTTQLLTGKQPLSAAVNPVTNKVYIANGGSNSVTVVDGMTYTSDLIPAGSNPIRVAVNPVTNKIYAPNFNTPGSVTVIDGASGATTSVTAGSGPYWVDVNPITNKVYVPNAYSNDVTVIDGATNLPTTVPVGDGPNALAVNPVTNKIYVADSGNPPETPGDVAVIDGATNSVTLVPAGIYPRAVAVNPVTNRIYVVNNLSNSVTVIDGSTDITTTVATGAYPIAIAVNATTNKIYVVNEEDNTVTVIDGSTNGTATVPVGAFPNGLAVNPVTNRIYVANIEDDTLTVIDGVTNRTTTIPGGHGPWWVAVNPVTNRIYVAEAHTVGIIDGVTNTLQSVSSDIGSFFVAVDLFTDKAYVVNVQGNDVTATAGSPLQSIPLTTTIVPLAGNQSDSPNPTFTFTAESGMGTTPENVFYQLDTMQNAWLTASGSGKTFEGALTSVPPGFHILFAYAGDGQEATSPQAGSPLTGEVQAYGFVVHGEQSPTTTQLTLKPGAISYGQRVVMFAAVESAAAQPSGTVIFSYGQNVLGSAPLNRSGVAVLATNVLPIGQDSVTATYLGNAQLSASKGTAIATVTGPVLPAIVSLTPATGVGQSQAFTAVYSDGSGIADLASVNILVNASESTAHACYVSYFPASNLLYLADDRGNETIPPVTPGQAVTSSNSQCRLSGAGSSVIRSGSTISVTFDLVFQTVFDRIQHVYLGAIRLNGLGTGAVLEGNWTTQAAGLTLSRTVLEIDANPNLLASGRVYVTNNYSQPVTLKPTIQGSPAFQLIGTFGDCSPMYTGEVCGVDVSYKRATDGEDSGTLTLNLINGPGGEPAQAHLVGRTINPAVIVGRVTLPFLTPVGTAEYERIYITNDLPYTLNLHPAIPSREFSLVEDCGAIAPFETCGINIGYTPTAVEKISQVMRLNFVNAPPGTPDQVLLEANSEGSPQILISTTRVRLSTLAGTVANSAPVVITNNTQKPIQIKPVVSGNLAFTFTTTCGTLLPKQSCPITVHYAAGSDPVATGMIALNLGSTTIQLEGFAPSPSIVSLYGPDYSSTVRLSTNYGTFQTSVITVLNGTSHTLSLGPSFSGVTGNASFHIVHSCNSIASQQICQMTISAEPLGVTQYLDSATLNLNPTNLQAGDSVPTPQVTVQVTGIPMP